MNSTTINLFLPHLHKNDTHEFIIDVFHTMAIGDVYYIDMKHRALKYAFIKIHLYNTDCSIQFMEKIHHKGHTRLQLWKNGGKNGKKKISWIVNEYIKKEDRREQDPFPYLTTNNFLESTETSISSFTKEDIDEMNKEFDELENLISEKRLYELVGK
jgi:hypothetical protein